MSLVELHAADGIVDIKLARAPVNALNPALCNDLRGALAQAVEDGAQGIVLSGGTKVFSAGLDVPHLLSLGDDRDALMSAWETFFLAARAIAECPVPIVAAIGGHAPAGGCVLALCCDYRVMARSEDPAKPFRIGLNETQVGLVVPVGILRLMQRVVGAHRAERLVVAGDMVEAERAERIGLVDELVPMDQVDARAREWLSQLLTLPQPVMRQTRAIARADLIAAMQPEQIQLPRFIAAWSDPSTQAALKALVAKLGK
ncbi:enoyl-CoA hydratase/isomerase family protein [Lysobacter arvi]|uniref:Enoyl-CoA hydratase/isomerase family protein n=1 Tax=Lysobacter arvi TaxID=3038776 RepID=A0ABU1CBM9_9GAMM|nr:enoyl-CoA hydratase/isomerase family protein [Lysobacter arvi]MDR0182593.1 enoyl-CoA hydratase/isomerase family protein [Lysobacter arvi]